MKYIVIAFETEQLGAIEVPVLFPNVLMHRGVAMGARRAVEAEYCVYAEIVSAGFYDASGAHGSSGSLGLSAHREDSALIERYFPGVCK